MEAAVTHFEIYAEEPAKSQSFTGLYSAGRSSKRPASTTGEYKRGRPTRRALAVALRTARFLGRAVGRILSTLLRSMKPSRK
jgi:hypothetical protein